MGEIDEKRIYGERREETVVFVASGQGVASVAVSGDQVGRFGLERACDARDVAALDGALYVATAEGVLRGPDEFASLGFGSAVAVGGADAPLAAGADGRVARRAGGEWTTLGTVDAVRAIDGDLLATAGGVYRADADGLTHVGLDDAADVAAAGAPLAATADGLYRLGNGWRREREGAFSVVTASADAAHAAAGEALYANEAGEWTDASFPGTAAVADVGYGECLYAVTADGTFHVAADPETTPDGAGGWRSRALGLPDVRRLAVV